MTAPAPDLPGVTVELPGQPDGVSWPTLTWATGEQLTARKSQGLLEFSLR